MDEKETILIVDDDESTSRTLSLVFGRKGYDTETATTGQEAIEKAQERFFNLALLDIKLPDMEGVELLGPLKEMHPDMVMIMATAYASLETAVWALNEGASGYITKPLNMDEVLATVREALEKQRLLFEKRRVEEALQRSKREWESTFDAMSDWVSLLDLEARILRTNRVGEELVGVPLTEMVGQISCKLVHDTEKPIPGCPLQKMLQTHQREAVELRVPDEDRWLIITVDPVMDDDGNLVSAVHIVRDITERKQAEEMIRYQANLVENVSDAIISTDVDFRILSWNKAAETIYGCRAEEAIGETTLDITRPEYLPGQREKFIEQLLEQGYWRGEVVQKRKDGTPINILASVSLLKDDSGNPVGAVAVNRDITERKQMEKQLEESENRLRLFIDNFPGVAFISDPGKCVVYANNALADAYGLKPEEVIGLDFKEYVYPGFYSRIVEQDRVVVSENRILQIEEAVHLQSGLSEWLTYKFPITQERRPTLVGGFGIDITRRKRAEEALRKSEERFDLAVQGSNAGLWDWDIQNDSLYWSPRFKELLGYSDDELDVDFETFESHLHPDDREHTGTAIEAHLKDRGLYDVEQRLRTKSGEYRWFLVRGQALWDEAGNPLRMVGSTTDITERKRAEEDVRRHLGRIEALREIDRAITSTLDLTGVLDIILTELERVIPYHSAAIFLFSDDIARLTAGRGFPDMERALQISFSVSEDPLTRELLQEEHPLVLADAQADERFLARGATGYVRSWIGVRLIAKEKAVGFLTIDHREPGVYDEESAEMAQAFAGQVAIAIENARLYDEAQRELAERERAEEELRQGLERLRMSLEGTVNVLISAIEIRDAYTAGHQRRVTELACAIADEMGLSEDQIDGIRMAGVIHDLGKIAVPTEILSKPGRLSDLEWGMIKAHPRVGYDILKTVEFPWPVADIVLQHHERLDGSGYPAGLLGEGIMLEARILAVADVVEAMASHRPYRAARGIDEALEEISQNSGILYDAEAADACLRLFAEKEFTLE